MHYYRDPHSGHWWGTVSPSPSQSGRQNGPGHVQERKAKTWWPRQPGCGGCYPVAGQLRSHIQRATSPVLASEEMGPLSPSQQRSPRKGSPPPALPSAPLPHSNTPGSSELLFKGNGAPTMSQALCVTLRRGPRGGPGVSPDSALGRGDQAPASDLDGNMENQPGQEWHSAALPGS